MGSDWTKHLAGLSSCGLDAGATSSRPPSTGPTAPDDTEGPPVGRKMNQPPGVARPILGTSIHLRHDSEIVVKVGKLTIDRDSTAGQAMAWPLPEQAKQTLRAACANSARNVHETVFSTLHNGQSGSKAGRCFST